MVATCFAIWKGQDVAVPRNYKQATVCQPILKHMETDPQWERSISRDQRQIRSPLGSEEFTESAADEPGQSANRGRARPTDEPSSTENECIAHPHAAPDAEAQLEPPGPPAPGAAEFQGYEHPARFPCAP